MIFLFQNFLWIFFLYPRRAENQAAPAGWLDSHHSLRTSQAGRGDASQRWDMIPQQIGEYIDLMGFNGNIIYRLGFEYDLPSGYD